MTVGKTCVQRQLDRTLTCTCCALTPIAMQLSLYGLAVQMRAWGRAPKGRLSFGSCVCMHSFMVCPHSRTAWPKEAS